MGFNLFDWIREGVRQSVLLGVSDAAEHLGSTADVEPLNAQLLAALQQQRLVTNTAGTGAVVPRGGAKKRKALGRTLNNIVDDVAE